MNNKYIHELIEELLEKASKEQIKKFLFRIIDEFPDKNNQEIVKLINENFKKEIQDSTLNNIDEQIEELEELFDLIDDYELQFHSYTYETDDYDYWGDNYETEYIDPERVGKIVVDAYNLATLLTTKKEYEKAQKIIDLILFTTYSILDDDCGDILGYDIKDIISYELVDIDLNKICQMAIYTTLLTSNNKCDDVYAYYETHIFDKIKIEDAFQIDPNNLNNLDNFLDDWIKYLSKKEGNTAYKLLTEALAYNAYKDYKEILKLNKKTHPELYLFVFAYLKKQNKYEEIIEIGSSVLKDMSDDVKNQISLSVATAYKKLDSNYDISNYLYTAFQANHSIPNLIRIINNGYLEKYKKEIDSIIKKSPNKNDNNFVLLYYFLGKFDTFLKSFKNNKNYLGWTESKMNTNVELMLFLLCNERETNIKNSLASSICHNIRINDNYNLYNVEKNNEYLKILNIWKKNFNVKDKIKQDYIHWLEETIDKRIDAIVSNKYRSSYHKAAFLVCALDECLENLKIKEKGEIIEFYKKKYLRYIAFKKEIDRYK